MEELIVCNIQKQNRRNTMPSVLDASYLLEAALQKHSIHLSLLIAETGFWASTELHRQTLAMSGSPATYPNVRRAKISKGERRGQVVDGIRLDDNTYANRAIKVAVGHPGIFKGFEACHIWPKTCYDERYHTAVANLVLLPRALAGLTDHDSEIQRALQYRAYELYGWWPEAEPQPVKPVFYPSNWQSPQVLAASGHAKKPAHPARSGNSTRSLAESIKRWQLKPDQIVHKVIAKVASEANGIDSDELKEWIGAVAKAKDPSGTLNSMRTNKGHAYGAVLILDGHTVRLNPAEKELISSLCWTEIANRNT